MKEEENISEDSILKFTFYFYFCWVKIEPWDLSHEFLHAAKACDMLGGGHGFGSTRASWMIYLLTGRKGPLIE